MDRFRILNEQPGIESQHGAVVRYTALPVEVGSPWQLTVRRSDGLVIGSTELALEYPSSAATFRVLGPDLYSTDPNDDVDQTLLALGTQDGSSWYPWLDVQSGRSPVPTYNNNFTSGGKLKFPTFVANAFENAPGTSSFSTQHASYWTQLGSVTADVNFTWWPPANSTYKFKRITVISDCPLAVSATASSACWNFQLWRSADQGSVCVCLVSGGYQGTAAKLGIAWHEIGHAIDWKYLAGTFRTQSFEPQCDPNTSEEGPSLNETIASLYAEMMYIQTFGTSTGFTDANGDGGTLTQIAASVSQAIAHISDQTVICHPSPDAVADGVVQAWEPAGNFTKMPAPCNHATDTQHKYRFGVPLLQAFWEVSRSVNCDTSCASMGDGAGSNEARWALFYAMKQIGSNGTYRDFVAHFLTYFFYDVGSTEWGNRWWVFNHHSLVGSDYGYSPCHVH